MSCRHPNLAATISEDFPNPHIIELYINPVVSSSDILGELALGRCLPDIKAITRLCELYFTWGNQEHILAKLTTDVIPSLLMFTLVEDAKARDNLSKNKEPPKVFTMITRRFYFTHLMYMTASFCILYNACIVPRYCIYSG